MLRDHDDTTRGRPRRRRPRHSSELLAYVRASEWSARPLDRLGQELLSSIQSYLEFADIARGLEGA